MTTTNEPRTNRWYLQYDNVTKVLDRAILVQHRIIGKDIETAPKLRETAEYVIDNYTGQNKLILSLQLRMWDDETLSPDLIAAAWRALQSEYTASVKVIKPAECTNCGGNHHIQRCSEIHTALNSTAEQRTGKTREQAQAEINELFPE